MATTKVIMNNSIYRKEELIEPILLIEFDYDRYGNNIREREIHRKELIAKILSISLEISKKQKNPSNFIIMSADAAQLFDDSMRQIRYNEEEE